MRRITKSLANLCLALLIGIPATALAQIPPVDKEAPAFSLSDTDGTLVSLSDFAYPGPPKTRSPQKVLVIDFFRTDCPPCRKSLPNLVTLHKKFAGRPVQVILVALFEEEEGEEKLDDFLKKNPLPFPVLLDVYGVVAKRYIKKGNGFQLPMLFVIDKNAVLRANVGMLDEKEISNIEKLVEELVK
ncbi:MAG: TlpA disulfide reductase family protein [Pseudomonadota bacterium]